MSNPFSNIINSELKNLYNNAIDSLLEQTALTVPCKLLYSGQQNSTFCNNCLFDSISQLSANIYNGTGSHPFPEGSICPVCMGMGIISSDASEIISLACIFNSKYFMNWTSQSVNVPDGSIQTICHTSLLPKIRNANQIFIDTNLEQYGHYYYQRAGDPQPAGFGDNRYIITMWNRV